MALVGSEPLGQPAELQRSALPSRNRTLGYGLWDGGKTSPRLGKGFSSEDGVAKGVARFEAGTAAFGGGARDTRSLRTPLGLWFASLLGFRRDSWGRSEKDLDQTARLLPFRFGLDPATSWGGRAVRRTGHRVPYWWSPFGR